MLRAPEDRSRAINVDMPKPAPDPGNRIPADYDFLDGPMARYPNGKWLINGEVVDMNALENPFDAEARAQQRITDAQRRAKPSG